MLLRKRHGHRGFQSQAAKINYKGSSEGGARSPRRPGPSTRSCIAASPQSSRLQQINLFKRQLEAEQDTWSTLYKMYHRGVNACDGVDTAILPARMGLGIGGVGLLFTIIAAPIVLSLEVAALACGLFGVTGKFVSRRLAIKAKKTR